MVADWMVDFGMDGKCYLGLLLLFLALAGCDGWYGRWNGMDKCVRVKWMDLLTMLPHAQVYTYLE